MLSGDETKFWKMARDCKALKIKAIERRITKHGHLVLCKSDIEDIFMSASEFTIFKEAVNGIINGQTSTNMIDDAAMSEIVTSVSQELDLSKSDVRLIIETLVTGNVDKLQLLALNETTNIDNSMSHINSSTSKKPNGKVESLRSLTASASAAEGISQSQGSHWFGLGGRNIINLSYFKNSSI